MSAEKDRLEEMGQVVIEFIENSDLVSQGFGTSIKWSDDAPVKLGMLFSEIIDQGVRHAKEA